MPFQSEKQRRFLHANHPEIAKRWERDYANGGISNHFRRRPLQEGGQLVKSGPGRPGYGGPQDWGQEERKEGPYSPTFDEHGGEGGPPSILNPPPRGPTATEIAATKAAAEAEKKAIAQAEYKNWWDATKANKT